MIKAIQSGEIMKPEYQATLRTKLFNGKNVHRTEFSIVFNNCIRSKDVKRALDQAHIVLPNKRDKLSAKKEAQLPSQNGFLKIPSEIVALTQLNPQIH